MSRCHICALIQIVFHSRITFGGYRHQTETDTTKRRDAQLVVRELRRQTWDSASQAKVFKAHVAPGLCENLIDALRLLANQQKDGSPIQSIVTSLRERTEKELFMEGLRNFSKVDSLCALEVSGGSGIPEIVHQCGSYCGDRRWWTLMGMPFAKQSTKELKTRFVGILSLS